MGGGGAASWVARWSWCRAAAPWWRTTVVDAVVVGAAGPSTANCAPVGSGPGGSGCPCPRAGSRRRPGAAARGHQHPPDQAHPPPPVPPAAIRLDRDVRSSSGPPRPGPRRSPRRTLPAGPRAPLRVRSPHSRPALSPPQGRSVPLAAAYGTGDPPPRRRGGARPLPGARRRHRSRSSGARSCCSQGPNGAGQDHAACGCAPACCRWHVARRCVLGADLVRDRRAVRSRVGLLGHANGLYDDLTVGENVRFWGRTVRGHADEIDAGHHPPRSGRPAGRHAGRPALGRPAPAHRPGRARGPPSGALAARRAPCRPGRRGPGPRRRPAAPRPRRPEPPSCWPPTSGTGPGAWRTGRSLIDGGRVFEHAGRGTGRCRPGRRAAPGAGRDRRSAGERPRSESLPC